MMRQYELVERVARYNPGVDEGLLNRAYVYAMRAHGAQKRASGDPYFSHPLEVAGILTDLHLDDATIAAALLHDTVEDTEATHAEIDQLFGMEISQLVDGLTKIDKLDLVSKRATQAENLRKLLMAIAEDVRVLLVKLADRLHNMRTLDFVKPDKRRRIAEETMDIYAPLAGRMGIQWMRDELEDLAFQVLQPDVHHMLSARLEELSVSNGTAIRDIEQALQDKLSHEMIAAEVTSRAKRPFSIWRKMESKAIGFEQLSDIYGFRVLVDSEEDCYRVVGIVHRTWPMVPGRFKDYISTPKENDYRSIHTTVVGPHHQRAELQIRTREMHEVAEYGVAAHAFYKDGVPVWDCHATSSNSEMINGHTESSGNGRARAGRPGAGAETSRAFQWLRRLIDTLGQGGSPEEFLDNTKLELFQDQVFCFTPKGRLIALPRGATAIDFAYAVHTDVGNTAISSKINGRLGPLMSELHNGDEVEIVTAAGQTPSSAWEALVATGKARAAIRRATRDSARKQYAGLGRQILRRACERAGKPYSDELLQAVISRLGQASVEDALAALGRSELNASDVLQALYPDYRKELVEAGPQARDDGWFGLRKAMGLKFKLPGTSSTDDEPTALPIRGVDGDLPVTFAPEGGALPGERIVGIITPGKGIVIYPIHSEALKQFDDASDRWIDVRWDTNPDKLARFPATIEVRALNEPGTLATVAQIIGDQNANIDNISVSQRRRDFHDMRIDLEVWNLKHLTTILALLKNCKVVNRARRVLG
ncbi:MAG: bifunctional (p)ppGpp synthetase/guanosine-3',5'-bis(diphosphate) 3'-pyrophosphohydrolase [Pseudomonadota bacterium]